METVKQNPLPLLAGLVAGVITGFLMFLRKKSPVATQPIENPVLENKVPYIEHDQSADFAKAVTVIKGMQKMITEKFQAVEEIEFKFDSWNRPDNNGCGQANIIQEGNTFEKGGVNYTELVIPLSAGMAQAMSAKGKNIEIANLDQYQLAATGCSLVLHAWHPKVPTIHANFRYMEIRKSGEVVDWWFGGGSDLTPNYLFREDAKDFHAALKAACDKFDKSFYPKYKKECDDYFRIVHRKLARGVGGIFFDDLNTLPKEELFLFIQNCAENIATFYPACVTKRKSEPQTEENRRWQEIRRGHYVEFNLVYDRGTAFGLKTPDANLEAIFMPMPLHARWEYKYEPEEGSPEAEIVEVLRTPVDWV